jgi:AraC-like DNA-binding protein
MSAEDRPETIAVVQGVAKYGRVPESLLDNLELGSDECRLYALLTTYDFRQEHECWPSQATLAERLGCSERSVRRMVANLLAHGAIDVIRQRRAPARILLLADVDRTVLAAQESKSGQIDAQDRPDRVIAPLMNETERETSDELTLVVVAETSRATTEDLFAFWQSATDHPRARLDAKRRRCIDRARAEYDDDEIRDAILGAARSPFHQGENDRGQKYDDLTLILRDATRIEAFRDLYRETTHDDAMPSNPANHRWFDEETGASGA